VGRELPRWMFVHHVAKVVNRVPQYCDSDAAASLAVAVPMVSSGCGLDSGLPFLFL